MLASPALIAIDPLGIPMDIPAGSSTARPIWRNVPLIKPAAADRGDSGTEPDVECVPPLAPPLTAAFSIRRFRMSCKFNRFL
jgi:hypothetical protein